MTIRKGHRVSSGAVAWLREGRKHGSGHTGTWTVQEGLGEQLWPHLVGGAWGMTWVYLVGSWQRGPGGVLEHGRTQGRVGPVDLGLAICMVSGEYPKPFQHRERGSSSGFGF